MKPGIIVALIVMLAAQIAAPLSMIISQESILSHGKQFKFQVEPVDPTDPFRGGYVHLDFKASEYEIDSIELVRKKWNFDWTTHRGHIGEQAENRDVYLLLSIDQHGYATVDDFSVTKPSGGDYLKGQIRSFYKKWNDDSDPSKNIYILSFEFPFDRFYLEESKAPAAERQYREIGGDSTVTAYALVKILEGNSSIEDVMLNDRSLRQIVEEENKKH